jgi:hypothetical protein
MKFPRSTRIFPVRGPSFAHISFALRLGLHNAKPSQRAVVRSVSWSIAKPRSFSLLLVLVNSLARPCHAT